MLLVFLYYRRRQGLINARNQQLLAEKTLENTNLKNHQLQFEIKSKQRDLTDFAINLAQNREWAEVLARKIDKLKATKGRQRKKLMDAFELEIRNKVNFDTENKDFYERLDKLSNSFYLKLRSEFPDLSKTDKILCSLIRLKIGSNEIARLQNITLASLNSSRYRLRKKFGLPKNVSLDDYIQSL
jgi:DNA-binding CsgD family transcriptional regulator